MHVHVTDDSIDTRTSESISVTPPCPRSVRAWRAWLGALANDAEAAQAAALAYQQLDASGRDAWIDSLAQDAIEVGVPRIAVYAPLLAVELDSARRQRIQAALGPQESGAAPSQITRALVGVSRTDLVGIHRGDIGRYDAGRYDAGRNDVRVAVLVAPLYMDFVQVLACGYRVAESFDWVRHDPIVSIGSVPRAGERVEGVIVEASPLKGVIDELALTIVAHQRAHGEVPPALRAFAHVFGPSFGG